MKIKDLPEELKANIKSHLKESSAKAEKGWSSCSKEEDSLTGHLFASLESQIDNEVNNWKWNISLKKFRGRGKGAFENKVGADGIISINIEYEGKIETKSILFQAKKGNGVSVKDQLKKMDRILPDGNMIILFTEKGYFGQTGKNYQTKKMEYKLGDYLSDIFIECKNGVWGVKYDEETERIVSIDNIIDKDYDYSIDYELDINIKRNE